MPERAARPRRSSVTGLAPRDAVARSVVFGRLPPARRAEVAALMRPRAYRRDQYVWRAGDPADGLYLLINGRVRVYHIGATGDEIVLKVWLPGQSDGEPGTFAPGSERSVSAQALEPSDCLFLERDAVLELVETEPAVARGMCEQLSTLCRYYVSLLTEVVVNDIAGRLALRLLDLGDRCGQPLGKRWLRIPLKLSQRTLAGMIAARREAVNRCLARFIAEGLIRVDAGYIVILDRTRMERIVGDPTYLARPPR